ncbi:transcriptional regulator [Erysipelatoclostridium sp. An173]|uniref:helix-turn-helix domain-containing protein n=2 Tax=Thomasclavelia TaxID=3025755 RepID=UPI000B38AEFB|nr:helix-turn-helix transcriptional regulator [Erysipelatoclostridium sp. An173]OUP77841.1 transcriptional regulator [Erysipelatoclostridium sp. An173]
MENISERVKKEREARGITLEELAKGTFISVAVLKDIESGNFDTFKGDELYLKMYLRKIAKYLGLEEKELDADFEALTQEIQLEEIRQEDLAKRLADENKKNITISEKVSDSFKDLKKIKPKKPISNKRVYEDRYLLRYLKYALVGVICIALVFVVWYTIIASKSDDSSDFNNNNTPTVEGNNEAANQNTDEQNDTENNNNPADQEPAEQTPAVTITKNGELNYSFSVDESQPTVKFRVEFVGRSWCQLDYNGSEYDGFRTGIYNDANTSNSLDATPEVVELEFNKDEFQTLELTMGAFYGHRFYINDTQIEIDPSEYDGGKKTLVLTKVQ